MENTEILKKIKSEARKIVPGCRVMLFGSRARGDYHKDSDYDILVICPKESEFKNKRNIAGQIRKALVKLGVLADVLVHTENDVKIKRNFPGHVLHYAMQEAKPI